MTTASNTFTISNRILDKNLWDAIAPKFSKKEMKELIGTTFTAQRKTKVPSANFNEVREIVMDENGEWWDTRWLDRKNAYLKDFIANNLLQRGTRIRILKSQWNIPTDTAPIEAVIEDICIDFDFPIMLKDGRSLSNNDIIELCHNNIS